MSKLKPIAGYEGFYSITITGDIISHITNKGPNYVLKQAFDKEGYCLVGLCKDNKQKLFKVHRLLAASFIPNPLNKPQVNHIDGNKSNNDIKNLEWCTGKENSQHAMKHKLHICPDAAHMDRIRESGLIKVRQPIEAYCSKTNRLLWRVNSITEAKSIYNVTAAIIDNTDRPKRKFRDMYFKRVRHDFKKCRRPTV